MESTDVLPLGAVVAALERLYPPESAQSWDRVGLVTGDVVQPVRRALLAVDPTQQVLAEAQDVGADLVITHHPLLLKGIHAVTPDTAKGAALIALVRSGTALYCAHTNADVADPGVGQALAEACGLLATEPLLVTEGVELGRVGNLQAPLTLGDFTARLAAELPPTACGLRVSGPADGAVQRVAVLGGAGDSAFEAVRGAGADVYVTADLRHHPALEAREEARAAAGTDYGTPFLVDAGHFASEWLWLPSLVRRLRQELGAAGDRLDLRISCVRTDPWDFVVGRRGHPEPFPTVPHQ